MHRRRGLSAAGALLMLVAQLTVLCAAPLAACTMTSMPASGEVVDCCPPGSHAPGQCPLHKQEAPASGCRLTCATQSSTPLLPGLAGVLPPSIISAPMILSEPAHRSLRFVVIFRSRLPISPPPKTFS